MIRHVGVLIMAISGCVALGGDGQTPRAPQAERELILRLAKGANALRGLGFRAGILAALDDKDRPSAAHLDGDVVWRERRRYLDEGTVSLAWLGDRWVVRGQVRGYPMEFRVTDVRVTLIDSEDKPLDHLEALAGRLLGSDDPVDQLSGLNLANMLGRASLLPKVLPYAKHENMGNVMVAVGAVEGMLSQCVDAKQLEAFLASIRKVPGGIDMVRELLTVRRDHYQKMADVLKEALKS